MTRKLRGDGPEAAELCRALGMDPEKVRFLRLEVDAGAVAVATVEFYPAPEEVEGVAAIVRHYELHQRDGER